MQEIPVLYEDKDLFVISKPAGITVHHDTYHKSGTIVDWLLERYPDIRGVGEDPKRPGVVHRLDKDTSGVLLIAKNSEAFWYFKKLFQEGNIQKTYLALVVGRVVNERGVISAPIARSTKNFQKRVVGGGQGRLRPAVTAYAVQERFGDDYTLLEVSPKTGRTHQIRSHLAFLGHPVACDLVYGGRKYACPRGCARQFLHAYRLELTLPAGSRLALEAPLPGDLLGPLEKLRKGLKHDIKEFV